MRKALIISTIFAVILLLSAVAFAQDYLVFSVDYSIVNRAVTGLGIATSNERVANYFADIYYDPDASIAQDDGLYEFFTSKVKQIDDYTVYKGDGAKIKVLTRVNAYLTKDDVKYINSRISLAVFSFSFSDLEKASYPDSTKIIISINGQEIERTDYASFRENKNSVSLPISSIADIYRDFNHLYLSVTFIK